MSEAPAAISLRGFGLTIRNGGREEILLQGCDLEVPAGGFYLLCGRSGSGKSTLLHLIAGLLDPREARPQTSGELRVLGTRIDGPPAAGAEHRSRVSAVLQDEGLLDELSPRQNVELALRAAGRSPKLAVGLLSLAGLSDPPIDVAALSGGMRKRAAVARALAAEPALFLFDEPTAGLDPKAAVDIAQLLRETHGREGKGKRTTIVISHDVEAFAGMLDGVLVLDAEDRSLRLQPPDKEIPEQEAPARWTRPAPFEDPALSGAKRLLLELGALAETFGEAFLRLPPSYPRLALRSALHTTLESILFVSMAAFLAGALAVYFTLENSPLSGAFVDELLTGAGKVLVVVVIPLVAGFFFTARMAAGAAARLGNMKQHNGVAALQLMGMRPADYLLTPLVWAFTLALPIVSLAAIAFASLSAALMAWVVEAVSPRRFSTNYFLEVSAQDLRMVLLKAAVSGFLVAVFTYHLAMSPKRSGRDVGSAVNLSIVIGMLTVLVVHGMATIWQFG